MAPTVLVTGDIVLEHRLYGVSRTPRADDDEPGTTLTRELGGAALLGRLLHDAADAAGLRHDAHLRAWEEENSKRTRQKKSALPRPDDLAVERPAPKFDVTLGVGSEQLEDTLPSQLHTYSVWTPQAKSKGQKSAERVWRMTGRFNPGAYAAAEDSKFRPKAAFPDDPENPPALIVIDDHAMRFRHDRCHDLWPDVSKARHVMLRMTGPLCRGELWPALQPARDKLIVIVSAADLRREYVQINTRLSWERAVEDTIRALTKDYLGQQLASAAHVVVNFGSAGVLWMRRFGQEHAARLVFDPTRLAGEHSAGFHGSVSGLQACLPLGIAYWLTRAEFPTSEDVAAFASAIGRGIASGLAARRKLLEIGHGEVRLSASPRIPTGTVAELVAGDPGGFTSIEVPVGPQGEWTVLTQSELGPADRAPLFGLGEMAARYGITALSHVPSFRRGRLYTADRIEIESLRTLESLIRAYEDAPVQKKPLSIGVFGPPGAGKSFAVKALAEGVLGPKAPFLEFNLSQFKGPEDLIGAFHRVRDAVLGGITPVAFWDEFDSRHYEWLQYLLAPMQDGAFQEREITHPIGKSIFVFAGGTSATIEGFGVREPILDEELPKLRNGEREARQRAFEEQTRNFQQFKLLKGPDFISRLHGFLHVLGPNGPGDGDLSDVSWPVRRGLLLRALLAVPDDRELQIDSGLLHALLRVRRYRHGARSFEKIVRAVEEGQDNGRLIRAALPPDSLLNRETDAQEFQELLHQRDGFKRKRDIDAIAAQIHNRFRETAAPDSIEPSLDKPYRELDEDKKAANRAAARRIPDHLALINFALEQSSPNADRSWKEPLREAVTQHVERLARAEHLGWCAERRANGWTYHSKRNDRLKQHPSLVPWAKLSPADQNKDRESVLAMPDFLDAAQQRAIPIEGA